MKYLVGIDLGTSNCAVAFVELAHGPQAKVTDFAVPQVLTPGESAPRPLLPSCLYLPSPHELPAGAARLPWDEPSLWIAGEFARWQGSRVPGRLVASTKSWLCHPGVDRSAPILPWGAPADVSKISPVHASALLLGHMAKAWNFAHPDAPLSAQEVIVTVPASFDEVARALTVNAAREAGLEKFTLVEEPQAAFYDFTARHQRDLDKALEGVRLVLVVDVGGGTSDFTLVQVGATPDGPALRRIAVGEHLMLGGDNMDAALARKLEERMLSGGRKLSSTQWTQLTQAARGAKEALLGENSPDNYRLSVASEGSQLVGRSLSAQITRAEAEQTILDGFFPTCSPEEGPRRSARVALQEMGLPYAQDPAVTRHLAGFLRTHAKAAWAALGELEPDLSLLPRPDAILLNGGVFNSGRIAARLVDALSAWWPQQPRIPLLAHDSLELAVARGAAYYGLVRRGLGRRIAGGAAHAFYVGLEKAGHEAPLALCVIPRGHEEGEAVDLGERVFNLTLNRPVQFPIFSTAADRVERPGELVTITEDLHPLPPIHTLLKGAGDKTGTVPVHLRAILTEIGTLELWCVSNASNEQWRLEFELRGTSASENVAVIESMPPRFGEARAWVEHIYGGKGRALQPRVTSVPPPKDVKQLWSSLERSLGPREEWRVPMLRELWGALLAGAAKRRRSAEHERVFFQLFGYTLRPGFGYPLDDWRCEQTFQLFPESVEFHKEKVSWTEFWILWRRVAGGLTETHHHEIWTYLKPYLAGRVARGAARQVIKTKGVQPQGLEEMVRLAASLEHLEPSEKVEMGDWIADRFRAPGVTVGGPWAWSLGRLGARVPFYGSIHKSVPPEKAAEWINLLLEPGRLSVEGVPFALAQMARLSGDRTRDLDELLRTRVLEALASIDASPSWQRMVSEVVVLEAADKARALGDTLPVGLKLA